MLRKNLYCVIIFIIFLIIGVALLAFFDVRMLMLLCAKVFFYAVLCLRRMFKGAIQNQAP